jgi:hypothetical protein
MFGKCFSILTDLAELGAEEARCSPFVVCSRLLHRYGNPDAGWSEMASLRLNAITVTTI